MSFSPPVVGCLFKKSLQNGGPPPWLCPCTSYISQSIHVHRQVPPWQSVKLAQRFTVTHTLYTPGWRKTHVLWVRVKYKILILPKNPTLWSQPDLKPTWYMQVHAHVDYLIQSQAAPLLKPTFNAHPPPHLYMYFKINLVFIHVQCTVWPTNRSTTPL